MRAPRGAALGGEESVRSGRGAREGLVPAHWGWGRPPRAQEGPSLGGNLRVRRGPALRGGAGSCHSHSHSALGAVGTGAKAASGLLWGAGGVMFP